jgi:hypothetical protein
MVVEGSGREAFTLSTVNNQNRWSGVIMLTFLSAPVGMNVGDTVGDGKMIVGVG